MSENMTNKTRCEIAHQYFKYLRHISTVSVYFILFTVSVGEFKISKYTQAYPRLAIPFVISSVLALALMAGLSLCDDQAVLFEKHRRLLKVGSVVSAAFFVFGMVWAVVFFIQH